MRSDIDAADWEAWVVAENAAFAGGAARRIIDALPAEDQIPDQSIFRCEPDQSAALRAELESLVRAHAGR